MLQLYSATGYNEYAMILFVGHTILILLTLYKIYNKVKN